SRTILIAEALDVVAELPERRCRRATGQAGAHHDDGVLPAVCRVDQLHVEAVAIPARLDGASGGIRLQFDTHIPNLLPLPRAVSGGSLHSLSGTTPTSESTGCSTPVCTEIGTTTKPSTTSSVPAIDARWR